MFNLGKSIKGNTAAGMQAMRNQLKQIAQEEKAGFTKAASEQGLPVSPKPFEAPKFELFPEVKEVSEEEKSQIEQQRQIKLQRLEEELKQIRMQRVQTGEAWQKEQMEKMHPQEVQAAGQGKEPPRRQISIPQSKPKGPNAAQAAMKQKQGSHETARQRST